MNSIRSPPLLAESTFFFVNPVFYQFFSPFQINCTTVHSSVIPSAYLCNGKKLFGVNHAYSLYFYVALHFRIMTSFSAKSGVNKI